MTRVADAVDDYRSSHAGAGYGCQYERTYQQGYYARLWRRIEAPMLAGMFGELAAAGRDSCLDFACGTGRITDVARRFFPRCTGVDVSDSMLDVAREKCPDVTFVNQDVTKRPLQQRFHVITAFRFFLNAEEKLRSEALEAMRGMLEPDGVVVINVHVNSSSILGLLYRLRNRLSGRELARTLGRRELTLLLQQHGFRVEEIRYYGLWPRTGWHFEFLTRLLMVPFERLFQSLPVIPRRVAQGFVVVCRLDSSAGCVSTP